MNDGEEKWRKKKVGYTRKKWNRKENKLMIKMNEYNRNEEKVKNEKEKKKLAANNVWSKHLET